jgi:hypothetical protein
LVPDRTITENELGKVVVGLYSSHKFQIEFKDLGLPE